MRDGQARMRRLCGSENPYAGLLGRLGSAWFDAMADLVEHGFDGLQAHLENLGKNGTENAETILAALRSRSWDERYALTPAIILREACRRLPGDWFAASVLKRLTWELPNKEANISAAIRVFSHYSPGRDAHVMDLPDLRRWWADGHGQLALASADIARAESAIADCAEAVERTMGPRLNGWDRELREWMRECGRELRDIRAAYLSAIATGADRRPLHDRIEHIRSAGPVLERHWTLLSWRGCSFTTDRASHNGLGLIDCAVDIAAALSTAVDGMRADTSQEAVHTAQALDRAITAASAGDRKPHDRMWIP